MKKICAFLLPLALFCSCTGGNKNRENLQNDYVKALQDSIEATQHAIDSCENQLSIETDQVNEWLRDFTVVSNPREVESYYIFQGWQNRYPLQSTGLVARISNGEKFELIGALKGSTFNSLTIEAGQNSSSTAVVPHDQALNYRREGLNTVMFSGEEADAVAQLIADNELNNITVRFMENGKVRGSWQMPDDCKKMISSTWLLYSARLKQMNLEGSMRLYTAKLNILRKHLEAKEAKE